MIKKNFCLCLILCSPLLAQPLPQHDLHFTTLARAWDEAIPLGNGMLGALIWQKDSTLRFSLDRADLWDLRPVPEFERPEFRFAWVREQVRKGDYKPGQELGAVPYERDPAPTKIPAGALTFAATQLGEVRRVHLSLARAVCEVEWRSGAKLHVFVHATSPRGWFRFENLPAPLTPQIAPPPYGQSDSNRVAANSVQGNDLRRLGYPAPRLWHEAQRLVYEQEGWNGFRYRMVVQWQTPRANVLVGTWSITTLRAQAALPLASENLSRECARALRTHEAWWKNYWQQSSVRLPEAVLEAQWYREQYKFGAASRRGAPPITLQAVWTADNGRIPPWKGDYHHDLNTQLSYWPCYSANHLEEGLAFLDWLWENKATAEQYTRTYFEVEGLNFPGVSTLTGAPMGGWIQYSLSPTVSAWLAQHFYLHWRYSMDREFLRERAYPWVRGVAIFLDKLAQYDERGKRKLPLSSSPEVHDNDLRAWFPRTTNYDLALIRWLYGAAIEMAQALGLHQEATKWAVILSEWPQLALTEDGKLLLAPDIPLTESHRHFSHLMAIHPLGVIDWDNGAREQQIISATLTDLKRLGTSWWTGYSFAWLGNLAARGRDGEQAAEALKIFATSFCLPNSFHVNGDQSGTGKSNFTYRPFTLEGNFAFAAGVQEMLLQSHNHVVRIFPAIPSSWQEVAFNSLRAQGAFLVSAQRTQGRVQTVRVVAEQGGRLRLANPFGAEKFAAHGVAAQALRSDAEFIEVTLAPGQEVKFTRK